MKPKFTVKWFADGQQNERFFHWGVDACDFARLLSNTNAQHIELYKDGKRW